MNWICFAFEKIGLLWYLANTGACPFCNFKHFSFQILELYFNTGTDQRYVGIFRQLKCLVEIITVKLQSRCYSSFLAVSTCSNSIVYLVNCSIHTERAARAFIPAIGLLGTAKSVKSGVYLYTYFLFALIVPMYNCLEEIRYLPLTNLI